MRRGRWIAAIKRANWRPTEYSFVCSAHFVTGKKSQDPISPDFVPSVFKYIDSHAKKRKLNDIKKYSNRKSQLRRKILHQVEREEADRKKRKEERCREEAGASTSAVTVQLTELVPDPPESLMRDAAVQTDSTSILCNETCIARVVQQLLQSDDAAVKFYTGLPTFPG